MNEFQLSYVLDGSGWATAKIQCGGAIVTMGASYLCDSLKDLGEAVLALQNAESSTAVFMQEPGEFHVQLARSHDNVAIEVNWFDDWKSWGIECGNPQLVFHGRVSYSLLRAELVRAMDVVLQTWGPSGYKRRWVQHPFPQDTLRRLREAQ